MIAVRGSRTQEGIVNSIRVHSLPLLLEAARVLQDKVASHAEGIRFAAIEVALILIAVLAIAEAPA